MKFLSMFPDQLSFNQFYKLNIKINKFKKEGFECFFLT